MTKEETEALELARSRMESGVGQDDDNVVELVALIDRLAKIEEAAGAVVHDWNVNGLRPGLAAPLFNLRSALAAKEKADGA